ncbi:hypothetical protein G6F16_012464 [Rhizopus arrhizus]|nr:hypothetical protein G6F19_012608 [Rhizopus arrhizus]KAG0862529.1 hypothetical protein G6F16_012464 [Rhizopus arrhizus]KAG0890403.1 hypothetical protein G6F34_012563 [Rhizopus arrhizus]KAG1165594.1 hypothetical protein G6F36_013277 [Rhizopus arrhizus]
MERFKKKCGEQPKNKLKNTPEALSVVNSPYGLLCFDPQYFLTRIPLPEDSQCILAQVSHVTGNMAPFHILVIYAPASSHRARLEFFNTLLTFRQLSPLDPLSCIDRMIIAGDFNYSLPQSSSSQGSRAPER